MGKYLDVGKKGIHFNQIANKVAREYIEKGYPQKKAREIGRKTAGKIFWNKFGKRRGSRIIRKARAKASKGRGRGKR